MYKRHWRAHEASSANDSPYHAVDESEHDQKYGCSAVNFTVKLLIYGDYLLILSAAISGRNVTDVGIMKNNNSGRSPTN
jgi:hypothetical protein